MKDPYTFQVTKTVTVTMSPDGEVVIHKSGKLVVLLHKEEALEMCQGILGYYARSWAAPFADLRSLGGPSEEG